MKQQYVPSFVLSLLASLWMLGTGTMFYGMGSWMSGSGMMGPMMPSFVAWPWFSFVAGIAVLVGAVMLYSRPTDHARWGLIIIVASAVNLFVGMGGLVPGVLGVVGGALALAEDQPRAPSG